MIVNTTMCIGARSISARWRAWSPVGSVCGFEDWDSTRLSPQSKVRFIDAPLYLYRIKKSSRSTELVQLGKVEESHRLIYERNRPLYEQYTANPIAFSKTQKFLFAPSLRRATSDRSAMSTRRTGP